MDPLATMVECVISRVSPSGRVVQSLVGTRGTVGRANRFARSLGFRDRHQLGRVLKADGLNLCLEDLAAWIRLLGWVVDAETSGLALSRGALHAGKDPGSSYRTVKRLTGRTWGEVRALGSAWVLVQFCIALEHPKGSAEESTGNGNASRGA